MEVKCCDAVENDDGWLRHKDDCTYWPKMSEKNTVLTSGEKVRMMHYCPYIPIFLKEATDDQFPEKIHSK